MAQTVLLKRSSVAGNVPGSSDLALGEIAVNTADGALYIKKGNNDIVAVADNDILHIDTTNSRIGIGTSSPTSILHVNSGTSDWPIKAESTDAKAGIILSDNNTANYIMSQTYTLSLGNQPSLHANNLNIKSTGKIGIGTTAPATNLHISESSDTTTPQLRITNDTPESLTMGVVRSAAGTAPNTSFISFDNALRFIGQTGTTNERMRITEAGNVGIGTSSPGKKLDVISEGDVNGEVIRIEGNANRGAVITYHRGSSYSWEAGVGGASSQDSNIPSSYWGVGERSGSGRPARFVIAHTTGNVGIGTASPSQKLDVQGTILVNNEIQFVDSAMRVYRSSNDMKIRTGSSDRVTITSGGNFLIGNATSFSNANADDLQVGNTTGAHGISIMSSSSHNGNLFFGDNDNNDAGRVSYNHTNNRMEFYTNRTQRMVILSDGNTIFGGTSVGAAGAMSVKVDGSYTDLYLYGAGTSQGGRIFFGDSSDRSSITGTYGTGGGGKLSFKTDTTGGTSQDRLVIDSDGSIKFNNAYTFPTADGSANQVLQTDGSGNITFATVAGASGGTAISDSDGDTKIQVEESSDEDTIRFDAAGVERFKIGSDVQVMGTTDFDITGASRRLNFTSGTGTVRTTTANSLILATNNTTALTINSSQEATFSGKLYLSGTTANYQTSDGNYLRNTTQHGYIQIGPGNASHAHFLTDRSNFYFNKQIQVDTGIITSHNEDLILRRAQDSGTGQLTLTRGKFIGGSQSASDLLNSSLMIGGFHANSAFEESSGHLYIPGLSPNQLAGSHRRHTVTITKNGTTYTPSSNSEMFSANGANTSFSHAAGSTDTIVITITGIAMSYGQHVGVQFGHSTFRAKDIEIELTTDNGANWTSVYDVTNFPHASVAHYHGGSGTATNGIRYTFTNFNNTGMRINQLFCYDYSENEIYFAERNQDQTIRGNWIWSDNYKAQFGSSSDLQIYHDGSNSYINEVGTGDLIIKGGNDILFQDAVGNTLANMNQSNSVELYFGGSKKFETTSTGIDITGEVQSDSLDVDGNADISGNLVLGGNLTVNGTQTTLNTATLTVDDLNITVADGAADSSAADGAGLTVAGAGASLAWSHGNQQFRFNKDVFTPAGFIIGTTATNVGKVYNSSGVMALEAYSTRSISFGNATNGEHVRIDATGNVGIGTGSPAEKLDVHGNARAERFVVDGGGAMLRKQVDSWSSGVQTHDILYNGWTSSTGDYTYVKAAGNGTTAHGILQVGDLGTWIGQTDLEQGALANSNTAPIDNVFAFFRGDTSYVKGNLGIGTSSPTEKLHIAFANTDTAYSGGSGGAWGSAGLKLENSSTSANTRAHIHFRNNDSDIHIAGIRQATNDSDLGFFFEGSEKVRFTNDGHVGIGTNNPAFNLQINDSTTTEQNSEFRIYGYDTGTSSAKYGRVFIDAGGNFNLAAQDSYLILSSANYIQANDTMYALEDILMRNNKKIQMAGSDGGFNGVMKVSTNDIVQVGGVNGWGGTIGQLALYSNDAEAVRIDADGKVGIGTTSPNRNLHIIGQYTVENSTSPSGALLFIPSSDANRIYSRVSNASSSSRDLAFLVGSTESMRINSSGNVGINETTPLAKLEVAGSIKATSKDTGHTSEAGVTLSYDTSNSIGLLETWTSKPLLTRTYNYQAFDISGTEMMRINSTGIGIGTTSPDTKLDITTSGVEGLIINQDTTTAATSSRLFFKDSTRINGMLNVNGILEFRTDMVVGSTSGTKRFSISPTLVKTEVPLRVEEYQIDTTETSTTATTQVAIHTFAAATFRSARFTVQVTNSTDSTYHTSELLLVHDGTTANITEFGEIHTGSAVEATFDADISSGNVRLLATPASTDTMAFKVVCHSITT